MRKLRTNLYNKSNKHSQFSFREFCLTVLFEKEFFYWWYNTAPSDVDSENSQSLIDTFWQMNIKKLINHCSDVQQ